MTAAAIKVGVTRYAPSPCVGICTMDEEADRCLGCARTGAEIENWQGKSESERARIWAMLPARLAANGIGVYRLPAEPEQLFEFVEASLRERSGCWAIGAHGAVAEFVIGDDEPAEINVTDTFISARTDRAGLRLQKHDKTRAFALMLGEGEMAALALTMPRLRLALPVNGVLTRFGPDTQAIDPDARDEVLYDLGIGRAATWFGLRTGDRDLIARLDRVAGQPWQSAMAEIDGEVIERSPTRVVETALARAEISTPIPSDGEMSPEGPHTHLLPGLLAMGLETPPEIVLPEVFVPCAVFYPREAGWLRARLGLPTG